MGKQDGIIKLEGLIDGLVYYKMNGEYYVRKKTSLNKDRIKNDESFDNFRKSGNEFGRISSFGKMVRETLKSILGDFCDKSCHYRLLKCLRGVVEFDLVSNSGSRIVYEGLKTWGGFDLLRGFVFNLKYPLSSVLKLNSMQMKTLTPWPPLQKEEGEGKLEFSDKTLTDKTPLHTSTTLSNREEGEGKLEFSDKTLTDKTLTEDKNEKVYQFEVLDFVAKDNIKWVKGASFVRFTVYSLVLERSDDDVFVSDVLVDYLDLDKDFKGDLRLGVVVDVVYMSVLVLEFFKRDGVGLSRFVEIV